VTPTGKGDSCSVISEVQLFASWATAASVVPEKFRGSLLIHHPFIKGLAVLYTPVEKVPDLRTINTELLLNVSAECNLRCTYCHWFKDHTVLAQPAVIEDRILKSFLEKLESHIRDAQLPRMVIVIHGGEPLLLNKRRFVELLESLEFIGQKTNCNLSASITTNGTLIDEEWASIFLRHKVSVTISIDGPPEVHNSRRLSLAGNNTHDRVVRGIEVIKETGGIPLSTLCVCDPTANPIVLLNYFFNVLKVKAVDFLIPKINHDDKSAGMYQEITTFYTKLFDEWYRRYLPRKLKVRICEEIIKLLLGKTPKTHSLYADRMTHVSISPDGTIEPLDNLRIGGNDRVNTGLNITTHSIGDVLTNELWLHTYEMARNLPQGCDTCEFVDCCHGGFIATRWSTANGYNNKTVYCQDIQNILNHAWNVLSNDLEIVAN
jgi:uncharacterized protein